MENGGGVGIRLGNRVRWEWEGLFGVGGGTHRQNIKILTYKEFNSPPKPCKRLQ